MPGVLLHKNSKTEFSVNRKIRHISKLNRKTVQIRMSQNNKTSTYKK